MEKRKGIELGMGFSALLDNYAPVIHWFFSYPYREASLSDLASVLKISKKTASKAVGELVRIGFLKKEILGKVWRLSCNVQHPLNQLKIPYNLKLIYSSGIIGAINRKFPSARAVILFGSYRKGDDTDESDIDIAIELIGDEGLKIIELGKINIGYRKSVPVNLHIFSRSKIDLNLFANIANGIVLGGFLEVRQ